MSTETKNVHGQGGNKCVMYWDRFGRILKLRNTFLKFEINQVASC